MALLCVANFITIRILLSHGAHSEADLPEMIQRLLGSNYFNFYIFISASLLFLVTSIYYIISLNLIYSLFEYALEDAPAKNEIVFDRMSFQWAAVITMAINYAMLTINDLSKIIKII